MTIKEFNTKIINQRFTQTDKHIVFQTPDGKVYSNVEIVSITQGNEVICKVKLIDKIEPKFKVGDVVTNSSGLYPDVKYTISKVNYDEQYYCYKEVSGVTYFKDQDKHMLADNIEPKFKAGDRVKNVSLNYPDKIFVINIVNTSNQCYHYFNSKGIITKFKDQDKLKLVEIEPKFKIVEGDTNIAIIGNNIVEEIDLYLNIEEVKTIQAKAVVAKIGSSIIESIIKDIKKAAAEGVMYIKW